MTKRIFGGAFAASLIAVIAAIALVLGVTYANERALYSQQIEEQTRLLAVTMQYTASDFDVASLETLGAFENRITYIAADGTVLFDNKADPVQMENHNDREEVRAARKSGNGFAVRESSTISKRTIYCARQIADGCVVRVSGTMDTVLGVVLGMWWEVLLALLAAAALSGGIAALVARAVVRPINAIDLRAPDIAESYGEIAPLLHRIKEQNAEISARMAELSRSREEFTLITENMSEGFIITDSRTEVLSYNRAALEILGADGGDGQTRSVLALNRSENFRRAVETALSGSRCEQELTLGERVYQLISTPVRADGGVSGAVLIILDITEKESREELRREFTSNVSHELKTPLTTIYGIADMIVGGIVKPEDIGRFAGDIRDEAKRLIALIEDIIKLSQLDENTFTDTKERVDILSLAELAASRLKTAADGKHVTINVSGARAEYTGMSSVLEEMIYNLLDNAVKYNREGGRADISVEDEPGSVTVTVADTGIGIPADSIGRVFERFYRVDKSHSRRIGGTGLGLSIVKHGAALHGGTVTISSAEGSGTTVKLTLPKTE